jgi:hypothetical protein
MNTYVHTFGEEDHVIFNDGIRGRRDWAGGKQLGFARRQWTASPRLTVRKGVILRRPCFRQGLKAFSAEAIAPMPIQQGADGGPETVAGTTPDYEWLWNNGYPQEMQDFIDSIRHRQTAG